MDFGLLILRAVFGGLLTAHGLQKLFGWFGGRGLAGTGAVFDLLGFRPGPRMALVAGISEMTGGVLLGFGLLSPLAGAVIVGTLFVAASVHQPKGLWNTNGGYELALLYAVAGGVVAISGPGTVSLDRWLGLDDLWSMALGIGAVVIGVASGAAVIARARLARRRHAEVIS